MPPADLTKHPLSNVEALHKLIEQGVAARLVNVKYHLKA